MHANRGKHQQAPGDWESSMAEHPDVFTHRSNGHQAKQGSGHVTIGAMSVRVIDPGYHQQQDRPDDEAGTEFTLAHIASA